MDGDFLSLYKSWLVLSWHLVLFLFQKPQGKNLLFFPFQLFFMQIVKLDSY